MSEITGALLQTAAALFIAVFLTHWANAKASIAIKRRDILATLLDEFERASDNLKQRSLEFYEAPNEALRDEWTRCHMADSDLSLGVLKRVAQKRLGQRGRGDVQTILDTYIEMKLVVNDSPSWNTLCVGDALQRKAFVTSYAAFRKAVVDFRFRIYSDSIFRTYFRSPS